MDAQEVAAVSGTFVGAVSCTSASQHPLLELPVNSEGEVEAREGICISGPLPGWLIQQCSNLAPQVT